jgi:hypothetical protein
MTAAASVRWVHVTRGRRRAVVDVKRAQAERGEARGEVRAGPGEAQVEGGDGGVGGDGADAGAAAGVLADDGLAVDAGLAVAGVDGDAAFLGELDGLGVEDAGAGAGEGLHLFVGDLGRRRAVGDLARVGGVDAVDVAVDLAVGGEGGGEGRRRWCRSRRGRAW